MIKMSFHLKIVLVLTKLLMLALVYQNYILNKKKQFFLDAIVWVFNS